MIEKEKTSTVKRKTKVKQYFSSVCTKETLVKYLKTMIYLSCNSTIGCFYSITGPTLPLLAEKMDVSTSTAGLVIFFRGIGLIVSSSFIGQIYGYVSFSDKNAHKVKWYSITHHKMQIVNLLFQSVVSFIIPFLSNFYLMCLLHFIQGVLSSNMELGSYVTIANVWRKNVLPFQQALQGFFGFGSLLFPIIVANVFNFSSDREIRLTLSYFICATIIYVQVFFFSLSSTPTSRDKEKKNEKKTEKKFLKKVQRKIVDMLKFLVSFESLVYFLTALLKGFFVGAHVGFAAFIFTFGHEKGLDSDVNLAYLNSSFFISFTIVRLCCIVINVFIKPSLILLISIPIATLSLGLFWIFNNSKMAMWILTIIYGVFSSPVSAAVLLFPQSFFGMPLSEGATGFLMLGQFLVGEMGVPTVSSLLMSNSLLGPNGILIVTFFSTLISLFLFIILFIIGIFYKCSKKRKGKKEEDEKDMESVLGNIEEEKDQPIGKLEGKLKDVYEELKNSESYIEIVPKNEGGHFVHSEFENKNRFSYHILADRENLLMKSFVFFGKNASKVLNEVHGGASASIVFYLMEEFIGEFNVEFRKFENFLISYFNPIKLNEFYFTEIVIDRVMKEKNMISLKGTIFDGDKILITCFGEFSGGSGSDINKKNNDVKKIVSFDHVEVPNGYDEYDISRLSISADHFLIYKGKEGNKFSDYFNLKMFWNGKDVITYCIFGRKAGEKLTSLFVHDAAVFSILDSIGGTVLKIIGNDCSVTSSASMKKIECVRKFEVYVIAVNVNKVDEKIVGNKMRRKFRMVIGLRNTERTKLFYQVKAFYIQYSEE